MLGKDLSPIPCPLFLRSLSGIQALLDAEQPSGAHVSGAWGSCSLEPQVGLLQELNCFVFPGPLKSWYETNTTFSRGGIRSSFWGIPHPAARPSHPVMAWISSAVTTYGASEKVSRHFSGDCPKGFPLVSHSNQRVAFLCISIPKGGFL